MRFLRNLRSFVITDFCIERCHQHQRIVNMFFNICFDRSDADGAFIIERNATIADQSCTMQKIINHHRFKNIQFKMTCCTADINGNIIAQNLCSDHRKGFALRGVYFARHNRRTRFIIRNKKSSAMMPLRGPDDRACHRISLAIFIKLTATVFNAPCASTIASCAASASNLFSAVIKGKPVNSAICFATFSE